MTHHRCNTCRLTKPTAMFRKHKFMKQGFLNKCLKCESDYAKKINAKTNRHKEGSLEHEMFEYFKKMKVYLDDDAVAYVVKKLQAAVAIGKYFKTLDALQEKFGAKPDNYQFDLLKELMLDRAAENRARPSGNYGRNTLQPVAQYNLEGDYITCYKSLGDASEAITGDRLKIVGGISHTCRGISSYSMGFVWRYIDEYEYEKLKKDLQDK